MVRVKSAVCVCCDDSYVPKAIVALQCFFDRNPSFDKFIIGRSFSKKNVKLAERYFIKTIEVDLTGDFPNLDVRPYGMEYPIECFYHFYAYKLLGGYDYIVNIEADVFTNRRLDVDLSQVDYVAGAYRESDTISKYEPIVADLKNILRFNKMVYPNQRRILGGFRVYNVKNLFRISFYEKITEYYKTSWENDAPRCGDDSLMVLYQLFNPGHITLLDPAYCSDNLYGKSFEEADSVYHFHFVPSYMPKPWDSKLQDSVVGRYFADKYVQFLYNNFEASFIKEHFRDIFLDVEKVLKINFCYWGEKPNFGDLIISYFLKRFCVEEEYSLNLSKTSSLKVIGCGSNLGLCNERTIVYGSGILDLDQSFEPGLFKLVRGPLTRMRAERIGGYCPPVYGDPALVLPLYFNPRVKKKYELGVVPHFSQFEKVKEVFGNGGESVSVIDLEDNNVEAVVKRILECKRVLSSSLYGLIISDAYGVPNKWVVFDNNITGDNIQFYDYFLSVKREDTSFVDCSDCEKIEVPELIAQIKPVEIDFDREKLRGNLFFDENGITNYTKYLYMLISTKPYLVNQRKSKVSKSLTKLLRWLQKRRYINSMS